MGRGVEKGGRPDIEKRDEVEEEEGEGCEARREKKKDRKGRGRAAERMGGAQGKYKKWGP